MGNVGEHLHGLFELLVAHLIEDEREADRNREHSQIQQRDGKCVENQLEHIRILEKPDKIVKTDPLAREDTPAGTIVVEGDHDAAHGNIIENNQINQAGKQHHAAESGYVKMRFFRLILCLLREISNDVMEKPPVSCVSRVQHYAFVDDLII